MPMAMPPTDASPPDLRSGASAVEDPQGRHLRKQAKELHSEDHRTVMVMTVYGQCHTGYTGGR